MDQNVMLQNQMTRITFQASDLTMKTIQKAIKLAIEQSQKDHKGINDLKRFMKNNTNLDTVNISDIDINIMNKVSKKYNFQFALEHLNVDENGKHEYAFYFNSSPQRASYIIQEYDKAVAKEKLRKETMTKLIGKKEIAKEHNVKDKSLGKEEIDNQQKNILSDKKLDDIEIKDELER